MVAMATGSSTLIGSSQRSPWRRLLRLAPSLMVAFSFCLTPAWDCTLGAERLTPERLWDLQRIGDVAVSPDGQQIAYLLTSYSLKDNYGTSSLMLQSLPSDLTGPAASDEGPASGKATGTDKTRRLRSQEPLAIAFDTPLRTSPAQALLTGVRGLQSLSWIVRPEGAQLLYIAPGEGPTDGNAATGNSPASGETAHDLSTQPAAAAGKSQAWMLSPSGGQPRQLTHVEAGIANLKPSPSGEAIAFTVDVKMDSTVPELFQDLPQADARIIDSLMYRHWNAWHDYAYSHLHVLRLSQPGEPVNQPLDLMGALTADCPVPPFGGTEQFNFSPDGRQLAVTLKLVNNPAESTDTSIYLVPVEGGTLQNIAPGRPGYDMEPSYSPDGRFIAFHSMERAGFEADRNRIMLYDRTQGTLREVTRDLDQTTHHATWSGDSRKIYFHSETRGTTQVYEIDVASAAVRQISAGRFDFSVLDTIPNSTLVIVGQQNMLRPTEIAVIDAAQPEVITLTDVNGALMKQLELPQIEERFFTATDGQQIQSWVILPPEFDARDGKQWPMLTYCQGGPQGQIGQWFSYRWNFHMLAAHGYVVLAPNRRGLPGFGQQWNDAVSGDWGGQAMQDILAATDGMLADPHVDRTRVAAVGASFGGYTVYWLEGNSANRFCAMVAHCGVYNLESMYGSTEELFFVNWDLGGPYWKNEQVQQEYNQFSPHRFAGNWRTPLLVIHGEQDFRVPVTQGMEAFTAAQVQGVPSQFLYFPNEGHWVQSPQNSVLWGRVFFQWLDRYCQPQ